MIDLLFTSAANVTDRELSLFLLGASVGLVVGLFIGLVVIPASVDVWAAVVRHTYRRRHRDR